MDLDAHITLVKLPKDTPVDLRDAKDLAQWHLEQLRLELYEMQICIFESTTIPQDAPYQCRDLFTTSPFFRALQKVKLEIMEEMDVRDPRWPHFSMSRQREILVLVREDEHARLQMHRWEIAELRRWR